MISSAHRLMIAIAALIFSVFGFASSATALAVPSPTAAVSAYNAHELSTGLCNTVVERGPQAGAYDYTARNLAADTSSHGSSVRPQRTVALTATTYDEAELLAQVAGVTGTTRTASAGRTPQMRAVPCASVAAKTGRNFDNYGGEFLDDAIRSPVVRPDVAGMSSKIQRQMGTRGWTPGLIDEAVLQGRAFPAVNKLGGANTPATRYVHPRNGQSVVIDNATGEIIQVGGPGFRY